tara:strand:- start:480 stop:1046 length:567 start_codon:yes stop_codon:yes gene_type:complete
MNEIALKRAGIRLERAKKALVDFEAADNYQAAEQAWTDFLLAASSFFSQIEQGVKGYPRSEAWFGRTKHQRKKDPVLRYLHFARNADEHGIEYVTAQYPDGGQKQRFGERTEWLVQEYDPVKEVGIGDKVKAWMYGPHIKLIRAYDHRFGDFCDPPKFTGHPSRDPADLGAVSIDLLQSILDDAADFI